MGRAKCFNVFSIYKLEKVKTFGAVLKTILIVFSNKIGQN